MAVAELIVSRRALLGAACAPLFGALPEPLVLSGAEPGRSAVSKDQSFAVTKWDRALTRFRRAEAAVNAATGEPDEDRYDALLGRLNRALSRLLRVPAPNLPALAAKLDLLIAHQVWELRYAEASMAALMRDAHRLAGQASQDSRPSTALQALRVNLASGQDAEARRGRG